MRHRIVVIWVLVACGLGIGCKKQEEQAAEPAASVDRTAVIDPNVAKAVAAASVGVPRGPVPAASGGPPPNGVFGPGEADREMPRGASIKLTLGGTGAEPRVSLGTGQPKPGWKSKGTVQILLQQDPRQSGTPIDVSLAFDAEKAPSAEPTAPGAAENVAVTATIADAKVSATGAHLPQFKGARISYEVRPDGSGTAYHSDARANAADVRDLFRMLEDTLAMLAVPRPAQPVGVGALWMVTSREGVFGLDLVTYRLVKVEEIQGDLVTLSIGAKRYAASARFDMVGLPPDAPRDLLEFQSKSDGRVGIRPGSPFPENGEIQSVLAAALGQGGQQRGVLQLHSRIGLDFGAP